MMKDGFVQLKFYDIVETVKILKERIHNMYLTYFITYEEALCKSGVAVANV